MLGSPSSFAARCSISDGIILRDGIFSPRMKVRIHPTLVIQGRWNTAILRPVWFSRIMPEISPEQKIPIEFSLDAGSIRFTIDQVKIQPTPLRLDLVVDTECGDSSSEKYCKKVINIATKIVEHLPHTPITAVGHNVAYDLSTIESMEYIPNSEFENFDATYKGKFAAVSLNTHRVAHGIDFSEYLLNLTYEIGRKHSFIDLNYHYIASDLGSINHAIAQFNTNIQASKNTFKDLVRSE